uniref:Uncharacterized protein n=1 Tax=Solanum tuberosum TaxID=4113 RepID=M1B3J5_SOLTU
MRFKYVPKGYTKLFNVNPRRPVIMTKVGICQALGFDLAIDDGYNLNYITPEVVAYLGLPRLQRTYPYTIEGCKVTEGGILVVHTCWYDPVLWTLYPFDPSECMKVFKLVGVSFFGWYYRVVEKNDHCPCSPLVDFKAMIIEDVWLFHEFESPRLNDFNANLCTTHHAKRISFLLMIYMVLQGLDSRTHFYLLAYDGTHTCVGCISYVSSGINWANESLLDSMLCNPFPFDPGVVFKCAECGSNTICHLHDSSVVLLLDPMCLNEVCLPIWVEDTYVLEPTHELGIIILLKLSSALDGVLIWVNTTYAFALRYESVNVLLDIREVLCFFGCGTNEGLHMRLFKCIGSFTLTLCQFVLLSQVSLALMGYRPFVDIYDAWLYVKFEHPWHGDEIVIANANPHAMRIFVLFASPMVLLGGQAPDALKARENQHVTCAYYAYNYDNLVTSSHRIQPYEPT